MFCGVTIVPGFSELLGGATGHSGKQNPVWASLFLQLLPVERPVLTRCFGQFHSWREKSDYLETLKQSPGSQEEHSVESSASLFLEGGSYS